MTTLTWGRLLEMVDYDPLTGIFRWRIRRPGRTTVGGVAGAHKGDGRIRLCLDGKRYEANRLAWLYVHGEWPAFLIDHRDTDPSNNAISNLREATPLLNAENQRRAHVTNQAGLLGVRAKKNGRFQAQIQVGGKNVSIGTYATAMEAHRAYIDRKRVVHHGNTL